MCNKRGWLLKGTTAIHETVAEDVNYTVFLRISNEGDCALMVKEGFFNQYFISWKGFDERSSMNVENTITFDNRKV